METEIINNSQYYKYCESTIKKMNIELWENIINYQCESNKFKEKFYLYENKLSEMPKCYCGNSVKFINIINKYCMILYKK